jgi:polyhydroxybutyrate depolymerase
MNDVDDVGFTRAVIEDIGGQGCIDLARVYATGMSNGGFMSHRLGCEASDVIAAIAPVAGVLGLEPSACNPERAVPIIHFHGTEDMLVAYEGGGLAESISVEDSIMGWADRNGCTDELEVTFQQGMVTCETADACEDGSAVTLCTVDGGGHCWPGRPCPTILGSVDLGETTNDISANDAMWDFFRNASLPK